MGPLSNLERKVGSKSHSSARDLHHALKVALGNLDEDVICDSCASVRKPSEKENVVILSENWRYCSNKLE